MELARVDHETVSCASSLSFSDELHAFVSTCQLLSAAVSARAMGLRQMACDLSAVLPRPRCFADFLLLRSIVAEFAMRAIETTVPGGTDAVLPLVRLGPADRPLGEVLVACLSEVDTNSPKASAGASAAARCAKQPLPLTAPPRTH